MSTGFDAGMRNHRITVLNKVPTYGRAFGEKVGYCRVGSLWSSYNFNKGGKALREGTLDAYDHVLFQMDYSTDITITRESLIEYRGRIYQITSLNADEQENKVVIIATEMTTQVNIIESNSDITGGDAQTYEIAK